MTSDERWLAAVWPFVRSWLPASPAEVVEIGCGPLGGFVPMLRSAGYDAVGVDPEAPEGPCYHRAEFERYEMPRPASAMIACTSLHHVADLGEVLGRVEAGLVPGGALVVVEWARERFDDATARWCFDRLPASSAGSGPTTPPHDDHDWLRHRRDEWQESGMPWEGYCRAWAEEEGMHEGQHILRELDARFDQRFLATGPFFFADLAGVSEEDERAAIAAGEIQAGRIDYVGRSRNS